MVSALSAVLERHSGKVLVLCVVAILSAGVVVCASLGDEIRFYDEAEYISVGLHIAESGDIQIYDGVPTAFRTPGYPMVIAVTELAGLGLEGARYLNFVFLALTIVGVYYLARTLAGSVAGALAAVLTAAYPFLPYTASTFYPQTLAGLLVVLVLVALTYAVRAEGRTRVALAAAAGLAAGMVTLVVPTFAFVAPVILLWLLIFRRGALFAIGLPLLVAALVLPAAWTIRNAVVLDSFVPLATSSGFNLWVGNHPGASASGRYDRAFMEPYKRHIKRHGLNEVEADDYYMDLATDWLSEHKGRAVTLYLGKLLHNFSWSNDLATPGQDSALKSAVGAAAYLPLLALLLMRLVLMRRYPLRDMEWLLLAVMATNAILLAVYATRVRYRLPVDTLMIVIVAVFLASAAQRWIGSRSAAPAPT